MDTHAVSEREQASTGVGAPGRLRRLISDPYVWFAVGVVAVLLPVIIQLPWFIDLGMHAAVLERWRTNFWNPGNPLIKVGGESPYYSPYMLVWTSVAMITDLGTFVVLRMASLANLILLLTGVGWFTRQFTSVRWAPIVSFLACVLVYGLVTIRWSGFLPLATLLITMPFPSTFALGCTLILWTLVMRAGSRRRASVWRQLAIAVLAAVIILSHQFSAAGAAVGVLVILVGQLVRAFSWSAVAMWSATAALIVLLTLLWPFFSVLDLLHGTSGFNDLTMSLYQRWPYRYLLLALCLPALAVRLWRDRLDPLAWTALLCGALAVYGGVGNQQFLARLIPFAAIPAQVALAVEAVVAVSARAKISPRPARGLRVLVAGVAVIALTAGAMTQAGVAGVFMRLPPTYSSVFPKPYYLWGTYSWAADWMHEGDVAMVRDTRTLRMLPAYGMYTVAPAYPDPVLTDEVDRRHAATAEFFAAKTSPQRRLAILDEYDATWVIAAPKDWQPVGAEKAHYQRVARDPKGRGEYLYRVLR